MVKQRAIGIVFFRRWRRSLAVYKVQWVTREWVSGVEDAAGPLAWFASLDTLYMVSPGSIGIERFWFRNVESCGIHVFDYWTVSCWVFKWAETTSLFKKKGQKIAGEYTSSYKNLK